MKIKKHLIAYSILILLPILVNAAAMQFLPSTIPAHYGVDGSVDRFGSKFELFILPICSLLFGIFMLVTAKFSSYNETSTKNNEKITLITGECCLGLFAAMNFYFLYLAFKNVTNIYSMKIEIGNIECFAIGILMIILGNIMPKAKMNSLVGFRCSWTMKSEDVWKKSQHFAGIASIIAGIFLLTVSFFAHGFSAVFVIIGTILIMSIICTIYAYKLSHQDNNN